MSTSSRLVIAIALVAAVSHGEGEQAAHGGDWMFRRSYFSHAVPHAEVPQSHELVPESRSAYRRPWVGTSPGFSARGAYRYNTVFLRSGNSVDVTVIREGWFEINP